MGWVLILRPGQEDDGADGGATGYDDGGDEMVVADKWLLSGMAFNGLECAG